MWNRFIHDKGLFTWIIIEYGHGFEPHGQRWLTNLLSSLQTKFQFYKDVCIAWSFQYEGNTRWHSNHMWNKFIHVYSTVGRAHSSKLCGHGFEPHGRRWFRTLLTTLQTKFQWYRDVCIAFSFQYESNTRWRSNLMWNRFIHDKGLFIWKNIKFKADLAQLVERKALNLVFMGSSPMVVVDWELYYVDLKPNSNDTKTCA